MAQASLKPTSDQNYEIIGGGDPNYNFIAILKKANELQQQGEVAEACNLRFHAVQNIQELLPEDEDVAFNWEHPATQAAIEIVNLSAIDHFLLGDYEMASALLEFSLEIDEEDHLEATNLLGYCYLAMEEYELFDEVLNDISDKNPSRPILILWSTFMREGTLPQGEMRNFKSRFAPYYTEFIASEHPADQSYLDDIESARPTLAAQARELWLKTESLWVSRSEFIEALRQF